MNKWAGEYCQKCGRPYRYVWKVTDKLWKEVVKNRYNLLCMDCFFELAEEKGIYIEFKGEEK